MSRTLIKICGITNLADARYAAGAGADFLGFIQYAGSPRFIGADMARDIREWLYGAKTVGVFVDASPEELAASVETAGFEMVQLHGNESPEACARIEGPVIKAIHVGGRGPAAAQSPEDLLRQAERYEGAADYLLLDTAAGSLSGGSGRTFDWSIVPDLPLPVFLAGGLTPDNVSQAIRTCMPFAVDTSSGVEEAPGRKDFDLIDAFATAVRAADSRGENE